MKYEITAEFTPTTVKTVARRFVLRLLGTGYFVAVVVIAIALLYLAMRRENYWPTGAIGAVFVFSILFPVVLWWKTERSGLSRLRRMSSPTVKFLFDDKGITVDSELGEATVGWISIEKIWEFPEAWLLFVGKQQYVTVPIAPLSEELKRYIKEKVGNTLG